MMLRVTKRQQKELDASFKGILKDLRTHFKTHGWPLSLSHYNSDRNNAVFGDLYQDLMIKLIEAGYEFQFRGGELVIVSPKPKKLGKTKKISLRTSSSK